MNYRRLIFSFLIFFSSFFVYPSWTHASTIVTDNITENVTWTLANSPYIVENSIYISGWTTLTIEPGVVVKFADFAEIYSNEDGSSIIALGTSDNKIYFTSLADDAVEGDTDGNGSVTISEITENSNTWYGISVGGPSAHISFDNVVFKYAIDGLSIGNILDVKINNSVFEKNYIGISDGGKSNVIISNSKIINNHYGISVRQIAGDLNSVYITSGLAIYGNSEYGLLNRTNVPPPLVINKKSIFDWIVFLFTPNEALAQEDPVVTEEDSTVAEEELPVYDYNLNFKNTWWGDISGPYNSSSNPNGHGNAVSGDVLFTPFCKNSECTIRNPVIIVPGILGTEINKPTPDGPEKLWLNLSGNLFDVGDQFMDALQFKSDLTPLDTSLVLGDIIRKVNGNILGFKPKLFDYSASLLEEFNNQGYIEGTDLFLFPYDWRFGVSIDNVNKLKQKIADVLAQTGSEKVDIVAHSMGGLVTKRYIIENHEHNIDKAIFVGVPNIGSPKAVKNLLVGDGNLLIADGEMKKLSRNMPGAYDLVPSEEYINKKGNYLKILDKYNFSVKSQYLDFDESNIFIVNDHSLNAQALVNAHKLHTKDFDNYDIRTAGIDLYAIDGCKGWTTTEITEIRDHGLLGGDGYSFAGLKIKEGPGDGTVPLESSTNLPIDEINKFYALKGEHKDMLSTDGIRQQILNILSGSNLETNKITQDITKCKLKGRAISIYSPLAIDIIDQDGNHAGLSEDGGSIENNIPNADFQIIDGHKFVYLPTDDGQTYIINVTGTGIGTFTLTVATIDANEITGMQVFKNISVTPSLLGRVNISDDTTLVLDDNGDGNVDRTLPPSSFLSTEEAENFIPDLEISDNTNQSHISSGSVTKKQIIEQSVAMINSPITVPEPISKNIVVKKSKIEKPQIAQVEITPNENLLTANVVNSNTPINYKIVIISLFGVLGLSLLAQKLNKG